MTNAEHILAGAENSQSHWHKLKNLQPDSSFLPRRQTELASAALNLAAEVSSAMIEAGDLSRMDIEASDILDAARLMLAWEAET